MPSSNFSSSNSHHVLIFLLIIIFVFVIINIFSPVPVAVADDAPTETLIEEICRQNEDFQFCNQTFHDNLPPNPMAMATIETLTEVTIQQALLNASNTLDFINAAMVDEKTDPHALDHLRVCASSYAKVKSDFQLAQTYFRAADYLNLVTIETLTAKEQANCWTIFILPGATNKSQLPSTPTSPTSVIGRNILLVQQHHHHHHQEEEEDNDEDEQDDDLNERNRQMRILITMSVITAAHLLH